MRMLALLLVAAAQHESAAAMFRDAEEELHHFDETDLRSLQRFVQPQRPSSLLETSPDLYRDHRDIAGALGESSELEQVGSDDVQADTEQERAALQYVKEIGNKNKRLAKQLAERDVAIERQSEEDADATAKQYEHHHSHHRHRHSLRNEAEPSSFVEEGASALSSSAAFEARSKEYMQSEEQEREVKEETANALRDAALADTENIESVSTATAHGNHVEVKDFKESMEAQMSAQKRKLSSFLENMKKQFQMKLDRDANETHMELKSMRLKEAKEMQKLEMKNGMQSSLLDEGFHHATLDPEILRQNDAEMARSRARVAAIQHRLEREETRMRTAAQKLAQTNAPDFAADSLSLDVLNSGRNFRK